MRKCGECGSGSIITDYKHGEVVCQDCGYVLSDVLFDFGPEWRAFDEEQAKKRTRAGSPLRFSKQNSGLTTEIDRYDRDIKGTVIPSERKAQLYRLRKWQTRSRMGTSIDRNLSIALPELDRMCSHLNVSDGVKESCARLYRKCVSKGIVRGRSIESVIAAIIYLICRQNHIPQTLDELKEVSGVTRKDIGKSYRIICRRLDMKMPTIRPSDYIPRLASELGISGETEAKAIELLKRARKIGILAGKVPISMAAAAIFLAGNSTGDKETKKIIPLSQIPESAIKNRYEELIREFKKRKINLKNVLPEPS